MALLYCGLDGEMTSSELSKGAKLIEVGVCTEDVNDLFVSRLAWSKDELLQDWSDEAANVHKIPMEEVLIENYEAPSHWAADNDLAEWLKGKQPHGLEFTTRNIVAIGFNVGTFDLPFFKAYMPLSWKYLSRRSVDLNAVCYTMGDSVKWNGGYPTHNSWKRLGKEYAEIMLSKDGVETQWHNAGYDAQVAMLAWKFYRMAMRGEAPVDFKKL